MDKIHSTGFGFYTGKCPGCGEPIEYFNSKEITVNIESCQKVSVGTMFLKLAVPCKNPFCEWSKLETPFLSF